MGKTLRMLCLAMAGAVWAWAGAASGGDADGSARLAACNPHDTAGAVCSRCGRESFLVRKLYDNRHWDKTRYSTVELVVYSAAAADADAQGSCLTYVTEGGAIDLTDNLDGDGNHLKLNGVHDIEQANHFMVQFHDDGWAYLKADLKENSAIRVTGEFGPYNPSYEAEAPNGKDRRMTLSTAGLLTGQEFYVIERSPGDYMPTGYVYVGDDAEADPRVDGATSGMVQTGMLENEVEVVTASGSSVTLPPYALYLTDRATGEGTTVFVVNSFDMNKASPSRVSDVTATASDPWDGLVSLSFRSGGPADQRPVWNPPFLSIVATDTATGSNYVSSASDLFAETPEALTNALYGSGGTVTWDMSAFFPDDFSTTGMVFTVDYLALPEYCVIDLTGGTNGATPAVFYLDAPPEGGWTDLYKTERLPMRLVPPETEGARPFYCALFETTQKQWELVTGGTPSAFPGATRPVERVSWNDIRGDAETCDWPAADAVGEDSFVGILRRRTGLSALDLPTEAQWEFACRGWRTTDYGYGHVPNGDGMWFQDNSGGETHEAGTRTTNFFGLHDMHGNVAEWCLDRASSTGPERVLRGGGWNDYAPDCTSSSRSGHDPSNGDSHCGFRLVRNLPLDSESERNPEAEPGGLRVGTVPTHLKEEPEIVSYSCESGAIALSRVALHTVSFTWHGGSFETNYPPGATLTVPDTPAPYTEGGTNYVCVGWSPEVVTVVTNDAAYAARYAIVPEVAVSCAVGGATGTNDEMTVTVSGPADCDGVADVAVYADETGAGEPVWATNGVALAAGRAEFTVSPAGGVVPAGGQHVFATYLPNDRYAGATASNRVMGTSAMAIGADDAYDGDDVTVVATLGHDDCTGIVTVDVGGDAYIGDVENGAATLVIRGLAAGDYDAAATYSGDDSYLAVSTNFSFTVFPWRGQEEVDGVVWYYAAHGDGTAMVTGVASNHATGNLTMPETLGGWTVTEVGGDAFMECTNITGMAIAGGVTNIMGDAFASCTGLTDMTIPDLVTDIGQLAFGACSGLTNVTVGAGVTNIENCAFHYCGSLATVSLPEGLVSIGAKAFQYNALADLRIPDSVADIGEYAFDISKFLTNVWLGTGIESVGENAFANCNALATVWVPVEQEGTGLLDAAGLPAGCEIHYYGTQTVTFDPNGGECGTATNAYAIGEAYGALPEAGRDGHDFAGWWDDAAGVEVTTNSIVTETAARTLVAHWKEGAVTYWDPVAGTNGVCTNYTAYTGQTTLGSGWYVVTGAITNDGRIGIDRWERNAEVNLILRDGAELVAKGGIEVAGAPEHHLVVWAQSDGPGAGKLTATAGDGSAGIGGTRDSNSAADGFKHVYGGRVTINGGAVTATGGSSGGAGIGGGQDQECEWVTVNGGTVEAIGGGTGGRAIGNGGSRSTYPAVMALHAGAKVLAGDDAAGAAPVAAPNRVAACLEEMYAKIGPCGPHEYEGGACKWCGAEDPLKQIVSEATGWAGTYDGAGHGVTVRVEEPAAGARVRYRAGAPGAGEQTEDWSESPVLFTNACNNAAVSVEISAEGYRTVTNHAAVTIRPAALAVTAKDQEYVYNGRPQGEGDTIYDDPGQIAAKVEAAGLKGEDRIGSVELDGQETEIGIYEDLVQVVWALVSNGTNDVTGNYEIGYARGTLTIAPPWQTVTFDPGGGTCGTETNQYRWIGRYGWLPEAARTLYTFDGWWATNEAGWARVGTGDRVTESFERTLVARWLEGVSTNGVRWLCETNGEGTVEVTGAVPAEGDLVMPEELDGYAVTAVGPGAFENCTDLTGMVIPDSVTDIGEAAFAHCPSLTNAPLAAGVTNIGMGAFGYCPSLADATIPDSVTAIADSSFEGCASLSNAWLGTGIETVGTNAFSGCDALAAVWVPVEQAGTGLLDGAGLPAGCEIHWYGTQTVTFDANGGTCGTKSNEYTIGEAYGALPGASRSGWEFLGWFDAAGGGTKVTGASVVTETTARTLWAHWRQTAPPNTWTVAYNANGGTGTMGVQTIRRGTTARLTANAFRRAGCTFAGWAKAPGGAVAYADKAAVKDLARAGGRVTLYARWAKTKYAVAYNGNGGTGRMAAQGMAYGQPAKLRKNAFRRNGWVFLGWAKTPRGAVAYRDQQGVKNLRADGKTTTLYAKWAKATYTVKFHANGGRLPSVKRMKPQTFPYGKAGTLRANVFIRSGCFFVGWAKTPGGAVAYADKAAVKNLRADGGVVTLYAKWVKKAYTVTYNGNGGTGTMHTQLFIYGHSSTLTANKYKRPGWTFAGWGTSKNGPVVYANGALVKNLRTDGGDTKLYAQWKKNAAAKSTAASGTAKKAAGRGMRRGGAASAAETETEDGEEARARVASVTTSDGSDGSAAADGDEETGWTPEGTAEGWAWVVLGFEEGVEVGWVEAVGENLPEEMRVLWSEDAEEWVEGETGWARYVWVAWPMEEGTAGMEVKEIRVEGGGEGPRGDK